MNLDQVKNYLLHLQDSICESLSELDGQSFVEDAWQHESGKGGGRTRVLSQGNVIEKGGVNFSHVAGDMLPATASAKRPELAGKPFEAMGVSLVIHPENPFAPTSHMNVRFFVAGPDTDKPVWWFGGGFDMTPYYGFEEDVHHWHLTAYQACETQGFSSYKDYKKWCDDYFYLPHRDEQRGVGGLFFDDLNTPNFDSCFMFMQSVGNHYIPAILPILQRRKAMPFQQAHRDWQLVRRGRYVEFNLVQDRGTLFGLQSGGRTESILMSLPPLVAWQYQHKPPSDSDEARLLDYYLKPRDWLAQE